MPGFLQSDSWTWRLSSIRSLRNARARWLLTEVYQQERGISRSLDEESTVTHPLCLHVLKETYETTLESQLSDREALGNEVPLGKITPTGQKVKS